VCLCVCACAICCVGHRGWSQGSLKCTLELELVLRVFWVLLSVLSSPSPLYIPPALTRSQMLAARVQSECSTSGRLPCSNHRPRARTTVWAARGRPEKISNEPLPSPEEPSTASTGRRRRSQLKSIGVGADTNDDEMEPQANPLWFEPPKKAAASASDSQGDWFDQGMVRPATSPTLLRVVWPAAQSLCCISQAPTVPGAASISGGE
jgi:hypothetical protein